MLPAFALPVFLLNAPPPPAAAFQLTLPVVLSGLALLFAVYSLVRRESREDGQTTSQRLKKLEGQAANHEQRHTGQEQAQEKLAAHVQSEINAHTREVDHRFERLEKEVAQVPQLRESMARMEEKLKGIDKLDAKLDRLTELLTRQIK